MTYSFKVLLFFILLLQASAIATEPPPPPDQKEIFSFQEIWGYLFKGEEKYCKGLEVVTDIAYFSAEVNETGRIVTAPDIAKIPQSFRLHKRVHLVISEPRNRSLMYWCLAADPANQQNLIEDIVRLAKPFDGVQINFETIRPDDREKYWEFLQKIKAAIPKEKLVSVAIPARFKESVDAFAYSKIAPLLDRVCVMAYDEHYDGSEPGSIACTPWCEKIVRYAKSVIPQEKLVMCIPLYGRVWGLCDRVWGKEKNSRPVRYEHVLALQKEHASILKRGEDDTPYFSYQKPVNAVVYFEDVKSLSHKLRMYQSHQIQAVGFWRIGQGPAALWGHLSHEKK